jgi:hypothetical protein
MDVDVQMWSRFDCSDRSRERNKPEPLCNSRAPDSVPFQVFRRKTEPRDGALVLVLAPAPVLTAQSAPLHT